MYVCMYNICVYVCVCVCMRVCVCSVAQFCLTLCGPMARTHRAPLSIGFSRQE